MLDILEGHICGGQHTLGAKGPECCSILLSEPISIAEGILCPVPAEHAESPHPMLSSQQVPGPDAVLLWQFELGSVHLQSLSASTGKHCTTISFQSGVRC